MDELKAVLLDEFKKIHAEIGNMREEFGTRFDTLEKELEEVKHIVRESAQDILENQVEEVARHNLHDDKIHALEATTFRIDKTVLELKHRVEKLEKANEK